MRARPSSSVAVRGFLGALTAGRRRIVVANSTLVKSKVKRQKAKAKAKAKGKQLCTALMQAAAAAIIGELSPDGVDADADIDADADAAVHAPHTLPAACSKLVLPTVYCGSCCAVERLVLLKGLVSSSRFCSNLLSLMHGIMERLSIFVTLSHSIT